MKQEDIIASLEAISKSGINVKGDLVLEKKVDYEVANVEDGGIGIQIINGERQQPAQPDEPATVEETEPAEEEDIEAEREKEELNLFAPKKNLQDLLREAWFAELRTDEKYDAQWTDGFVEALMASEYGETIARQWAVKGVRNKRNQIKGYVVGLLKDSGVLAGSNDSIARQVGITEKPRTFSSYMGDGKHQPYAEWVKEYVVGTEIVSEKE